MSVRNLRLVFLVSLLAGASAAMAETAPLDDAGAKQFFNTRSCNACHAVDETRIGPAYRTVALRYRDGGAAAESRLATKIIEGGAGSWGNVPMIGYPKLPPEEARAIAHWILRLAPAAPESAR